MTITPHTVDMIAGYNWPGGPTVKVYTVLPAEWADALDELETRGWEIEVLYESRTFGAVADLTKPGCRPFAIRAGTPRPAHDLAEPF